MSTFLTILLYYAAPAFSFYFLLRFLAKKAHDWTNSTMLWAVAISIIPGLNVIALALVAITLSILFAVDFLQDNEKWQNWLKKDSRL